VVNERTVLEYLANLSWDARRLIPLKRERTVPRNIELKARLSSIDRARKVAEGLATDILPDQYQVDTYFRCPTGRLKLREIYSINAELIWYLRDDLKGSKESRYEIVSVEHPTPIKKLLAAAYGVLIVVDKRRSIVLHNWVRIHLDQVAGLGDFIEFEAVLADHQQDDEGHRIVEQLALTFGLRPEDRLAGSYSDLLARRSGG
jgi:predicted adenylyl cyclase CyaB